MPAAGIGWQQVLGTAPLQSVAAIKTWSCVCSRVILGPQLLKSQSACESLVPYVLQLFEYILEYLRTVRFGEPDHSLALPADQTELAQIVREVNTCVHCCSHKLNHACIYACLCSVFLAVLCVLPTYVQQLPHAAVACTLVHVIAAQELQVCMPPFRPTCFLIVSFQL